MAFQISKVGYGNGKLKTVTSMGTATSLNAYAFVTEINSDSVAIDRDNAYIRAYETFVKGAEVLFHVSAVSDTDKKHLGKWATGTINSVNNNFIKLDFDPTEIISTADFGKYYCQLITIPRFENLTLAAGTSIAPLPYSAVNHYGGIIALKCSDTLTLSGGHIDLSDYGIPPASKDLRPQTNQEENGTKDTSLYSGWENAQTKERFLLNCGDGAAFIIAKTLNVADSSSRIGNASNKGVQFCRGASDSPNLPNNATNIGGSTILIAAETISSFDPQIISKYRNNSTTAGQGLCRCYIASETVLRNDEGLYAYDCLNNSKRVGEQLNVRSFGNGGFGNGNALTAQLNNYATVTAIEGAKISYTGKTFEGVANIQAGALVMIHANHKNSNNTAYSGRFFLAEILEDDGSALIIDALPERFFNDISNITENYAVQIVSIPQYNNFTLSATNSATPQFNGSQGGIFAVAVEDTCDIRAGKINVMEKGGGKAYGRGGLAAIGNAQNAAKLPIGQGHGSVFILAKNLTMNANTRIGATYSGAKTSHNTFGGNTAHASESGGGYSGKSTGVGRPYTTGGWGGGSGTARWAVDDSPATAGGYGGNGYGDNKGNAGGQQGAHIMIIANTITGFNQAAISTGGAVATGWSGNPGSAGYGAGVGGNNGSGGGYNGGGAFYSTSTGDTAGTAVVHTPGGGGSGWAFVYCNNIVNQDTTDTVYY